MTPTNSVVVAHTAENASEAMVIRGLLESAGIHSPAPIPPIRFRMNEPPEGTHGVEIFVLESQADEARKMIAEYAKGNEYLWRIPTIQLIQAANRARTPVALARTRLTADVLRERMHDERVARP